MVVNTVGNFSYPRGVTVSHRGVAWAAGPKKRIRQGSEWAVYLVGPGPRRPEEENKAGE